MIVLDTHVLIWLDQDSDRLGAVCRGAADEALAADELSVSAISFWEVAMLAERGRLGIGVDIETWRRDLLSAGLRELALDGRIGVRAATLAGLHADPADRLIVATAEAHEATLATADRRLLDWPADLPRMDAQR